MTDGEPALREQLRRAVEPAEYPVESRTEVVGVLPEGMLTRFEAGAFSMTAAAMAARLYEHQDFPCETPDALVDDLIAGLEAEDFV